MIVHVTINNRIHIPATAKALGMPEEDLEERFDEAAKAGKGCHFWVEVSEQQILESMDEVNDPHELYE